MSRSEGWNQLHIIRVCAFVCYMFFTILTYSAFTPASAGDEETNDRRDIIILFQPQVSEHEQAEFLSVNQERFEVIEQFDTYVLCQTKNSQDTNTLLKFLNSSPLIQVAEINKEIEMFSLTEDPYSDTQWALKNNGEYTHIIGSNKGTTTSTKDIDLNIAEAWKLFGQSADGTKEVIIAILDTGVDTKHPDLKNRIWKNRGEIPNDGIDNDGNGYIDDVEGWDFYNNDNTVCHYSYNVHHSMEVASPLDNDDHGTHCAGIIAANANNKAGIAGVASNINVKIMPLKIHGGLNGKGTVANAIKAVKYATLMGADICNMSWGTTSYSAALETVIKESPMLFVTAAGNTGTDNTSTPLYPASYKLDNVISVTFIDANGQLTLDSNYGILDVDIAAPGTDIFSTVVGSYTSMSGSSMAAPHVSAIAAMIYSYSDNLYASNIKDVIIHNLKPLSSLNGYVKHPGIPDAGKIVSSFDQLVFDYGEPTLYLTTSYDRENLLVDVLAEDMGFSGIRTIKYAIGERQTSYFKKGTSGLSITGNTLSLAKSGIYTFYVSDYAGNESSFVYDVVDDVTPPEITTSYKVSYNYDTVTISGTVNDTESGVKTVKYLAGIKTINDFRSVNSGKPVSLKDNKFTFTENISGRFTIYAQDYRGNKTITIVNAKVIRSTALNLNREKKELGVGKSFRLYPALTPSNSTDRVVYRSSNPEIATVSRYGLLTGISPGRATITAVSSSGASKTCIVTVKYPKS